MQYRKIRKEYKYGQLSDDAMQEDPMALFEAWIHDAQESMGMDVTAFTLSTVDSAGMPDARILLLKDLGTRDMTFYTNWLSKKSQDLHTNPKAHALFFWPMQERQIRVQGTVRKLPFEEGAAYFSERPIASQQAAMASTQSAPIASRDDLEAAYKEVCDRGEEAVRCPEHWGGYAMSMDRIEFWQGRPNRLHDRIVFEFAQGEWTTERLQP